MALISLSFKKIYKPTNNNLRTSSNTSRANQDNTPRINRGTGYDNQRVVNVARTRENVGTQVVKQSGIHLSQGKYVLCKQEKAGFQLNAEQADWRDDTDDKPEDQELEAHYMYMAQIQEVTPDAADNSGPIFDAEPLQKVQNNDDNYNVFAIESEHPEQPESVNDTYSVDQDEHNIIIDSFDMSYDREQVDQDDDNLANERDLLASLIEKLKCEIDDSKNLRPLSHQKLEISYQALGASVFVRDHVLLRDRLRLRCNWFGGPLLPLCHGRCTSFNAGMLVELEVRRLQLLETGLNKYTCWLKVISTVKYLPGGQSIGGRSGRN
ncbi:hypothetical protein Tco_0653121 [Tanacetum coccineum]|uniref:Uncharacterized protein n=1 Tax=Tanacetum coccineum TaxID=301880 RepID=A0ABQ4WZG5_9ASTR